MSLRFVSKASWLKDKVGLQSQHHVMMGSDCVLDWSHVPHLKSAQVGLSWKKSSCDAVKPASEHIPDIICSSPNETSKQQHLS